MHFSKQAYFDSKMRISLYKILNNTPYFSKAVYKMKIANSPLCTFCSQEDETIKHVFLSCEHFKRLWENVSDWENKEQYLPNLNPKNVIIGFVEDNSGSIIKNPFCCYINGTFIITKS